MKTLIALLAAISGVAGCGDDGMPAAPSERLPVVYEHGGGFAAQPRLLKIDRAGHAVLTATAGTKTQHREFDLTAEQRKDLEAALDAAAGGERPSQTGCADCYTFSVTAPGIDVDLDEVSYGKARAPLKRLIVQLEQLSQP